jgi:RES domain-containing protein
MALDVDDTAVTGSWWRHIPHDGDVWYRPPHAADGRWQRGAVVEALYLADSPDTVWAEWYHLLAEYALRPSIHLPRDLWRWRVKLPRVADLSTPEKLDRVGLTIPPPGRGSWPAYQAIGEQLHAEGWPALIAPSAARPESGLVLCCFRKGPLVDGLLPLPPPELYDEAPAPPQGLRT